jgi:selenocysteine lyase/cysteine desulfurase
MVRRGTGASIVGRMQCIAASHLFCLFLLLEIIISSENHLANVNPWLSVANRTGAKIKWWTPTRLGQNVTQKASDAASPFLRDILTPKTRILAIPHASNICGQLRDIKSIRKVVDTMTGGNVHLVVDGVAASPHCYPELSELDADWYVVSCHKLFGPHIGALVGKQSAINQLSSASKVDANPASQGYELIEQGTINYEGAGGVSGLGMYMAELGSDDAASMARYGQADQDPSQTPVHGPRCVSTLTQNRVQRWTLSSDLTKRAYKRIRMAEDLLTVRLMVFLRKSERVRIIEISEEEERCMARLPVISFVHQAIPSSAIVDILAKHDVVCRHGCFLANSQLLQDFGIDPEEGVVRLSLVHYNMVREIDVVENILESIPDWF